MFRLVTASCRANPAIVPSASHCPIVRSSDTGPRRPSKPRKLPLNAARQKSRRRLSRKMYTPLRQAVRKARRAGMKRVSQALRCVPGRLERARILAPIQRVRDVLKPHSPQ
ncbi:hypothetical protein BRPE64_ACDS13360 [Caballeronia insecticola]|uniref:Uncharacterized protein n=1 Tax=Caballeronia insecticola TaxID=758793 RepID=R4WQA1_9BURK|nr:hypothetical protein BRPE64_ACDS13360 [Caballeronia insecticola]